MTSYKKVVEMLGESLASLLELAKRWLIDWGMEPKKLLYLLLHLRKEDLVGLLAGTHEITPKAAPVVAEKTERAEKFALLVDLGVITVPDDYVPGTQLASFKKKNHEKFSYYNDAITDANFSNPTRVLKPGEKLFVRVFHQIVSGNTTSEERMEFLSQYNPVYTGAQGASIVWEQKRDRLPKGKWYSSFDEKDRLWKDSGGYHRVPLVWALVDGDFKFDLGRFENPWGDDGCILCFCDLPATAGISA